MPLTSVGKDLRPEDRQVLLSYSLRSFGEDR